METFLAASKDAHQLRTPQAYAEALHLYTGDLVVLDHRAEEDGTRGYRDLLRGLNYICRDCRPSEAPLARPGMAVAATTV